MLRIIGIVLLGVVGWFFIQGVSEQQKNYTLAPGMRGSTPPAPLPDPVLPPEVNLIRLDRSYSVLEGGITLVNPNAFAIKDARIYCSVFASSGTAISSYDFQLFEKVPAKGKKTISKYNFGFWPQQGKSISCIAKNALRAE